METTTKINYRETDSFRKDFKKLLKRYRTLEADLNVAKTNSIELFHLKNIHNQSIFLIPGFCSETIKICKIKKFACKALKGRGAMSGIRVIYAFNVTSCAVEFIEIYFKADKENEDQERIKEYLENN